MLLPEGESKEFLGQEFLTWLWFYGETNNWTLELSDTRVDYGMDELLVLEPPDVESCSQRLSGPVPIKTREAQVGLLEGKKITATRLILVQGENEWSVTLKADEFHFSSLQLMTPTTADVEERFMELSMDLEKFLDLFDQIYRFFLAIRLSEQWEKQELPAIRDWIHGKK